MKQTKEPIIKNKNYLTELERISEMELRCIESGLASDIDYMNLLTRKFLGEVIFTYKDTTKKLSAKLDEETDKICELILEGYTTANAIDKLNICATTFYIGASDEQKLRVKLAKKESTRIHGNSGLLKFNVSH
jgi:hypothetical protein